jgi:hypothetical protein
MPTTTSVADTDVDGVQFMPVSRIHLQRPELSLVRWITDLLAVRAHHLTRTQDERTTKFRCGERNRGISLRRLAGRHDFDSTHSLQAVGQAKQCQKDSDERCVDRLWRDHVDFRLMKAVTDMTRHIAPSEAVDQIVREQRTALIRAEVLAGEQRTQLERAVRDAVLKMGRSIDAVSEASGLTPAEIREIAEAPSELESLDALAGVA